MSDNKLILHKDQIKRSWEHLKPYGTNKILTNTTWFLILVPLIAKNFDLIPFTVNLPFSWATLWAGALFFTVSQVLFIWKCPKIVKDYKCFPDFESTQWGLIKFNQLYVDVLLKCDSKFIYTEPTMVDSISHLANKLKSHNTPVEVLCDELTNQVPFSSISFNWVYSMANRTSPFIRFCIHWGYILGFTCVAIVTLDNIRHVVAFLIHQFV